MCYSNRGVVKAGEPDHIALAIGRHAVEPHGSEVVDYIFGLSAESRYAWGLFGSGTLMARKKVFRAIGRFDERFRRTAEMDFAIRAAVQGAHFIAVNQPLCITYKTATTDKAGKKPLTYGLMLREKYRDYLTSQHAYVASRMLARSAFHGNRHRQMRKWAFKALAYASAPKLLVRRLKSRLAALGSVFGSD